MGATFIDWAQYLALRGASGLMGCFDVAQNLRTAEAAAEVFYRWSDRRRRRAEHNIAMSFPDWPAEHIAECARRSVVHMFQLLIVDALNLTRRITHDTWPRYIHLGTVGGVLDRLMRAEPMILLTGHCGNWELMGYFLGMIGFPVHAVARPLDNPLINRWMLGIREARGMRIVTKWGASTVLQDVLRGGGRIGFIADQNAGDDGLFVPFFNHLASSYKSIGLLAMRYRVPIAAGWARRVPGRFEYELSVTDTFGPEDWSGQPDPLFYITARFNRAIERMICESPEQYLWMHRRWKSRPRHEREGRPVPPRLIEKLQSLPWMTPHDLEVIVRRSNDASRAAATGAPDAATIR
jgi:KDO2-lipid IV(A) lauroyltransferase